MAFLIGASWRVGSKFDNHYEGIIDELRISKTVRYTNNYTPQIRLKSDDKTLALYHFDEGKGQVLKDSSPNKNDGKIVGSTWVLAGDISSKRARAKEDTENLPDASFRKSDNYALSFDGKDDYVDIPTLNYDESHPLTVELTVTPQFSFEKPPISQWGRTPSLVGDWGF